MALFFWSGSAEFLIQEKQSLWIEAFKQKHGGDMNISVVSGTELSVGELIAELETFPFLAEKRLIFVKDLPATTQSKFDPAKSEKILAALPNIPETNVVVFVQPQPDKRTAFYKGLQKLAQCEDFAELKDEKLSSWTLGRIKKHEGEIQPQALSLLLEMTGNNLWKIENEVKKLLTFTQKKRIITTEDVQKLVVPEISSNIFAFLDAVSEKKKKRAIQEMGAILAEGESVMQLFALLSKQIRNLLIIKSDPKITKDDLVKEFSLHPFVAQKTLSFAKNFSFTELKNLYKKMLDIDIGVKTGKIFMSTDNERLLALEIEKLILGL